MILKKKTVNEFQKNGVVVLRNIVESKWLEIIAKGIIKNFEKPSKYKCVYEKYDNNELFYDDYCNWNRKYNSYKWSF